MAIVNTARIDVLKQDFNPSEGTKMNRTSFVRLRVPSSHGNQKVDPFSNLH